MLITPNSRIILLKNPIEMDNLNQLTFSSATAQYNYFYNLPKLECDNATYQRKDDVIRFPTDPSLSGTTYEDLLQYNYCMYQNTAWDNKWFYAFIKSVTFDNPGMSLIELETDVFQSWQFNIIWKRCFVEREHVNDDTIGLHTVPENVELGEFIVNSAEPLGLGASDMFICVGLNKVPSGLPGGELLDRFYGGVYSGLFYIIFDSGTDVSKFIKGMDEEGWGEYIYSIFMIPTRLSFSNTWITITSLGEQTNIKFAIVSTTTTSTNLGRDRTITINSTLDSYTPKNNKLFTYPYNYIRVTNNAGNEAIYKYEDFTNNTPTFDIDGVISVGCSIKMFPKNYKRTNPTDWRSIGYGYGLTCNKYPTCSWTTDVYTNWLTQNSVNLTLDTIGNIGNMVTGAYSGNYNQALSGLQGVGRTVAQVYEASFLPPQVKGDANTGDVTCGIKEMGFTVYQLSVRNEYAKIIDDYFSMYGYKVNRLKTPNITGRTNWNYVKTIGCNITGNIPQQDIIKIKQMFDNGVTLWHNSSTFLDYSQSNNIV